MGRTLSDSSTGAVAALVVATAPDADPRACALLWRSIAGSPLLAWSLRALAELGGADGLAFCALVSPEERDAEARALMHDEAPAQASVVIPTTDGTWHGALASGAARIPQACEWIIALDAVQPLVTAAGLRAGLLAARRSGVAIAGEPVKETLKRVRGQVVTETPARATLARLLAPAIFRRELLTQALSAPRAGATDVDDLVAHAQRTGAPLVAFDTGSLHLRVAAEPDLAIVEALLRQREREAD